MIEIKEGIDADRYLERYGKKKTVKERETETDRDRQTEMKCDTQRENGGSNLSHLLLLKG